MIFLKKSEWKAAIWNDPKCKEIDLNEQSKISEELKQNVKRIRKLCGLKNLNFGQAIANCDDLYFMLLLLGPNSRR